MEQSGARGCLLYKLSISKEIICFMFLEQKKCLSKYIFNYYWCNGLNILKPELPEGESEADSEWKIFIINILFSIDTV